MGTTTPGLLRAIYPEQEYERLVIQISRERSKNAFPGVPKTVIQYYTTQEAEVGPSSFLRNKVQGMQYHKNFEGCFNHSTLVKFEASETFILHAVYRGHDLTGDDATVMDIDDILALHIHLYQNLAPRLSESFDTSKSNLNS
ncbi:MAG: hypothetical protein J3Q66DRAFT_405335 [Benniella sp.]|nr:MAG: hypothetical protein J3Q66DRAFT_405335 [Benniella sp.]